MGCTPVGISTYPVEVMVRAFEYFATSRTLYRRLRDDYKLPSVQTLTNLTSKVSKLSDANFIHKIFNSILQNQRECIILFDEIYVKKMLLYHGGSIFGKAANDSTTLAAAVLGIMVDCMYGSCCKTFV